MAIRLASLGHKVIATMRNLQRRDELDYEIHKRKLKIDVAQLDVTDIQSIGNAVSAVKEKYKRVDVLINNAGYGIGGFFEDLTEAEIRQQFETNFFGVQNMTREVLPIMRSRKKGRIINISSISGFTSSAAFGAYSSSKWALEAFSESLREEMKFFGIDVLLVEPGIYDTAIFKRNSQSAKNFDNPKSPYYHLSQFLKKKIENTVGKSARNPEEVAALVEKLINAKNPPFRTIPDRGSQIHYLMHKFLPFKLYSWVHQKVLFGDFKMPRK